MAMNSTDKDGTLYRTWTSMKSRCSDSHPRHEFYADKGISVCDRWLDGATVVVGFYNAPNGGKFPIRRRQGFLNFIEDMGERPDGTSLDRIDNDEGYSPENCRWATDRQQVENRSVTNFISYNGKKQTLTRWAEDLGIARSTLSQRLYVYCWSIEKTLSTLTRKGGY